MKPRKPLPRSTKPLKRTPLRRIGKRGKEKAMFRRKVKADYFKLWGASTATCQWCGRPMDLEDCAAHHKIKRSLGGKDVPENILVVHHHCHTEIHSTKDNYEKARDAGGNAANRGGGIKYGLLPNSKAS